jgi:hypothetical protein
MTDPKRRWLGFSIQRLVCWIFPLLAISGCIGACPYDDMGISNGTPPGFIAAKAIAIGVLVAIWSLFMWEDRRAIRQSDDTSSSE